METTVELNDAEEARIVFGPRDKHLKLLRDTCHVQVVAHNSVLTFDGEPSNVEHACAVLNQMLDRVRSQGQLSRTEVIDLLCADAGDVDKPYGVEGRNGWLIAPRTKGQQGYMEAIDHNPVIFCIGPAGTGKTFLAVAMAVGALRADEVKKIVLVRPVVEAGERLGFLPGDVQAKVDPYIRPLYDALSEFIEFSQIKKYVERDLIEIAPLAYMRGRTLNDAFVILDEAQNTTAVQMKMFLTRLGVRSKMVITGDTTQIDLPNKQQSGLVVVERMLAGIDGIAFSRLAREDIVRHPIVQKIVDAYEKTDTGKTEPQ